MSRDSCFTYLHLHASHHADHFEDFSKPKLPVEDIIVADAHKPIDPDEQDDITPDQSAASGIQRATRKSREPVWKDLDLQQLLTSGPTKPSTTISNGSVAR